MSTGFELIRKTARVLRREGIDGVLRKGTQRVSGRIGDHFAWPEMNFPLLWEDVVDSQGVEAPAPRPSGGGPAGDRLRIGWVCFPPAAGSGGHTTLFRMVEAMEQRGHECVLFLYDRDSEDVSRHAGTIRRAWPNVKASIRSARPGIDGVDAVVASSWETAHVVASRSEPGIGRFYFVQDYEPFFYPRGHLWELAEDTYRFGFTIIALGWMVADCLERFGGVRPDRVVPFGCDTDVYRPLTAAGKRSGIVFYAKKKADRRGYWLAKRALELFHREHPEQEIHVVGDRPSGWSIPTTQHGSISPEALNELYNSVLAGVALSFTNISLAAEEMLAAGAIPVVNDSPFAKADLEAPGPIWARPTPAGIAAALSAIVELDASSLQSRRESSRLRHGWGPAGDQLAETIEGAFAQVAGSISARDEPGQHEC